MEWEKISAPPTHRGDYKKITIKSGFHIAVRCLKVPAALACNVGSGFRIIWKQLLKMPVPLVAVASAISNYMETSLASATGSRNRDNSGWWIFQFFRLVQVDNDQFQLLLASLDVHHLS